MIKSMPKTTIIKFCEVIAPPTFPINYLYRKHNSELGEIFIKLKNKFVSDYNKNNPNKQIKDIAFTLMSDNEDDEFNIKTLWGDNLDVRTITNIEDYEIVTGRIKPCINHKDQLRWRVRAIK